MLSKETGAIKSDNESIRWALELFGKSPLKQQKFRVLEGFLPAATGLVCLDIGADNGIISYLLRLKGGQWHSCDLSAETVESIRALVGERVVQIDDSRTPYDDQQFDVVVIVDFLEHIQRDRDFIAECHRIIKPDGILIVNVPNPKEGLLRRIRFACGQTDEKHGHLRAGYALDELTYLLGGFFRIESSQSYHRFFSELVDFGINLALQTMKGGAPGRKGTVVTGNDLAKMQKSFRFYALIYPFMALAVALDQKLPFLRGNMLAVKARRVP
jgi:SAM-dependent methyltransferase